MLDNEIGARGFEPPTLVPNLFGVGAYLKCVDDAFTSTKSLQRAFPFGELARFRRHDESR
jgi:hypothetical protein